jgi:hypothetical protein
MYEDLPRCFVNAADLPAETGGKTDADSLLRVMQAKRECPKFRHWQQGFTPHEHLEMLRIEQEREFQEARLKADKEFQEARRKEDREWQQKQREDDLERQKKQREEDQTRQDRQRSSDKRWQLTFIVLAALVGTLVAALKDRIAPAPDKSSQEAKQQSADKPEKAP